MLFPFIVTCSVLESERSISLFRGYCHSLVTFAGYVETQNHGLALLVAICRISNMIRYVNSLSERRLVDLLNQKTKQMAQAPTVVSK